MLRGVGGRTSKEVNRWLLRYAADHHPALFIDCADCANPQLLFPDITYEQLTGVRMLPAESLYRLKTTLHAIPKLLRKGEILLISTFDVLYNYGDEEENDDITDFAWELLKDLGKKIEVVAAVPRKHEHLARKYCDHYDPLGGMNMGHTIASQRNMVDIVVHELESYGKSLREEDRVLYERLVKKTLQRVGSISYVSSVHTWAFVLLSIMLEQEKRLMTVEQIAEQWKERTKEKKITELTV